MAGELRKETSSHLEGAEVMDSEELEMLKVLPSLPFVNNYKLGKFYYIRECYDEYYDIVMGMLDEGDKLVTVTGTPGIGKSIFYGYLFQCLREEIKEMERKDTWIIAAAYRRGELNAAIGFKDNNDDAKKIFSDEEITDFIRAALQEKKSVILLADGPPSRTWGLAKTVVFTSPNESWMRSVRKDFCTLYMPLWTLPELQKAAKLLAIHRTDRDGSYITGEVIEERFYNFGGVARECFLLEDDEIFNCQNDLARAIDTNSNPRKLEDLISGQQTSTVCHRVLHWVPLPEKKGKVVTSQLASPFVKKILAERLMKISKVDRERLRKSLTGLPEGAAFSGWLFEIVVHETLGRGCTLQLRPLPSKEATPGNRKRNQVPTASKDMKLEPLEIEEGEIDEFKLENLSAETATLGPYHQPMSKQFESIDGFYIRKMPKIEPFGEELIKWNAKHRLIMVQTTISQTHPVNASGMLNVLDKLGLIETVKAHPERVALVFVVPEPEIAAKYERQNVRPERHKLSALQLCRTTKTKLKSQKIESVDQLREAILKEPKIVSKAVKERLNNLRDESYTDAMVRVPQFVCCLPGEVRADEDV